jgi:hypothetical protein
MNLQGFDTLQKARTAQQTRPEKTIGPALDEHLSDMPDKNVPVNFADPKFRRGVSQGVIVILAECDPSLPNASSLRVGRDPGLHWPGVGSTSRCPV